jgi:hypothetical protein
MVVVYNGRATDSNRVAMQYLCWVNVIHAFMILHTVLPNIVIVHKQVEIEMDNRSTPPHKFTDLCQEVMWLKSPPPWMGPNLCDAIIPVVSGHQQGSAIVTYHTDTKEATALIQKIRRSVAGWFYGY